MKTWKSLALGGIGCVAAAGLYFNPSRDLKQRWQREKEQALDSIPVHFAFPDSAQSYTFSMTDIARYADDKRQEHVMPLFHTLARALCATENAIQDVTIGMRFQDGSACAHHAGYQVAVARADGTIDRSLSRSSCNARIDAAYANARDFAQVAAAAYRDRQGKNRRFPPKTNRDKISEILFSHLKP